MVERIIFTPDQIYRIKEQLEHENRSDEFIAGYIEGLADGYNAMNEIMEKVLDKFRNSK